MASTGISIRAATVADAAAIASLGAATFRASFAHSMPAEDMEAFLGEIYTPSHFEAEISGPHDDFFVATLPDASSSAPVSNEDKVVGFIQVRFNSTDPCLPADLDAVGIERLYVDQTTLSKGVGGKLMQHALEWLKQNPYGGRRADGKPAPGKRYGVFLGVWDENYSAQRFYKRFGFEKVGKHPFVMGKTTQTDWIMCQYF